MAQIPDEAIEVLEAFSGTETTQDATYALEDFSAKEAAVAASMFATANAGGSPGAAAVYPYATSIFAGAGWSGGTGFTQDAKFTWANGQNGDTIEWDVLLAAGEYSVRVKFWAASDAGIAELAMDDGGGFDNIDQAPYSASGFQVDAYSAGSDTDAGALFTGLTVAEDGTYVLRVTINGKNGSSSGTDTWLKQLDFIRTGD